MIFQGHYRLERNSIALVIAIIIVSGIGGFIEIAPLFTIDETVEDVPDMRVYTPLELAGRNIYLREGCYACHSQMIRTLRDDVDRYGHYSLAAESQYDHPMLWGSKRTGPDLARVGEKYSDTWHTRHLNNPRDVVPESIMPAYRWLLKNDLSVKNPPAHLRAMRKVGVPYNEEMIANATEDMLSQATPGSDSNAGFLQRYGEESHLRDFDGQPDRVTEMDALVSYLQILGKLTDIAERTDGQSPSAAARAPAATLARQQE